MALAKTMTAVIKLAGKVDGSLIKSFASTEKRMSGVKKVAAAVLGATGAAVVKTVKSVDECTDKAAAYQKQYAKVKTLLADGTDTEAYSRDILKASAASGIATDSLTESVYQSISASVDQGEAIKFAVSAAKLAKGGFTDAATSVDVLTTAINAYGLGVDAAEGVSDMLITTQNLGKTSVNELASSIGKVIPTARAYGVDLQNVASSYAIMTKNGIKTRQTTTFLNSMLNELGKSGSGVAAVLKKKTGNNFAELQTDGKSLYDVLEIINDSVKGDSTAFMDLWSSQNAGKAAMALVNAGGKEYAKTLKKMEKSSGATAKAAGTMGDTYEGAKAKMANAIEVTKTAIGMKLIPVMTEVSQEILPRVQQMASDAIDKLDGVDLGQLADDAARMAGETFDNFKGLLDFLSAHKGEIAGVAITLGVIWTAVAGIGAVSGAISAVQTIAGAAGGLATAGTAAAAGEAAMGTAAAVSAPQLLAMGAAALMIGGGIAIACVGMYALSQAAVSIASSGPAAGLAMVGMVAGIAALAAVAVVAGPALAAGAVGMVSFGAAVTLVGAGVMMASAGIAVLATQMPMIAGYGPAAATGLALIAAAAVSSAPGIAALALAVTPAALALAAFTLAAAPAGAAMSAFGWGVQAANQSIWPLVGGLAASQGSFSAWSSSVGDQASSAASRVSSAMASMRYAVESCHLTVPTIRVQALPHLRMSGAFNAKTGSVPSLAVDYYARGGFTRGVTAIAGEAGREAIISFDHRYRQSNIGYWLKAGQMLGIGAYAAGGIVGGESSLSRDISSGGVLARAASGAAGGGVSLGGVTFAPVVTVAGDAGDNVIEQLRAAQEEFIDMLDEWAETRGGGYAPVF